MRGWRRSGRARSAPIETRSTANVAIFTDNDFDKVNGVTTALSAVLRYAPPSLRARIYTHAGHAVDRPDYLALRSLGVGLPFYREMKVYVPRMTALRQQAQRDRINVIHLTTPGPVGLAALRVAARLGLRLVGSFHTDLAGYTRRLSGSARLESWMRHLLRWVYGQCDDVFVPSEATRAALIDDGIPAHRITVWTRGVDAERFSPDRRSAALRRQWGVGDDELALVYLGRVSREKSVAMLPELQTALHDRGIGHKWIVIGDGPYRSMLQQQLRDAVFTGTLAHAEVAAPLASSDLFVFPSCTDTAGNVVLEAQACGVPVIVTDQGGPHENIARGRSGRVCPGSDVDAFCEAIVELARAPSTRQQMAAEARRYALSRRWEDALAPLYDAYARDARPREGRPDA